MSNTSKTRTIRFIDHRLSVAPTVVNGVTGGYIMRAGGLMVAVSNVRKTFTTRRKTVVAVDNVSFTAEPGMIYGLLGPNGAGKTTMLRCIATLLTPDRGSISVDGLNASSNAREIRDRVGFLTGDMKLSGNLTPRELLRFFGELNHMELDTIRQRVQHLSGYLAMDEFLDRPMAKLSSGMKQKTAIAVSLIHDPQIIIFDEPTAGLDLLAAKTVADFLHDFRERGRTVLLSTHIMSEAEKLCDTIGILLDGALVAEGSKAQLTERYGKPSLEEVFFSLALERGGEKNGTR